MWSAMFEEKDNFLDDLYLRNCIEFRANSTEVFLKFQAAGVVPLTSNVLHIYSAYFLKFPSCSAFEMPLKGKILVFFTGNLKASLRQVVESPSEAEAWYRIIIAQFPLTKPRLVPLKTEVIKVLSTACLITLEWKDTRSAMLH